MVKPKILIFTTSYYPFIGGAEIAIQEITKRLACEFDFFIITARMRRDLPNKEVRTEGTVLRVGFGSRLDKYLLIFAPIYYRGPTSIVMGVDISQGAVAAAIYKLFYPRISLMLNLQFGYGEERLRQGRLGMISLMFRFMLREADYVTAISTYLLNLAKQYGYNGPAMVIPNGVDIEKFKIKNEKLKNKTENSKIIITTSRLVPKNGVDILIKAMAEIKKTIPDIYCHILGDGPERENYKLQIVNYKLENNVKLFGEIPYDKIPGYLHRADVFVRPSRSEGMGNSFVEALAAELPIIGTPVGGITDIIEDGRTGLFSRPNDSKNLAERIIQLLQNPKLAKTIVDNGKKIVEERFSWNSIAASYKNLFVPYSVRYKKVVVATPLFPPDIGGPATYSRALLEEFPKRGINVEIVNFGTIRHLPKVIRHTAYFWRVFRQALHTDIVFAQDPVSVGLPAYAAARILGKKFFLKIVGDYAWEQLQNQESRIPAPEQVRYPSSRAELTTGHSGAGKNQGKFITLEEFQKRRFDIVTEARRFIGHFVARRADKIIVPSKYLKDIISQWGIVPEKIAVVYNSFDYSEAPSSKEEARKILNLSGIVLVSAGRLVPWKGFGTLIELMPEIRRKFPEAKLLIIGEGPEEKSLKFKVKSLKLEGNVIFTGKLAHKQLLTYFAAGDVFILNTGYEGFSHILLEAMALAIPIVTTRVGGNPEIIQDKINGILIQYDNKEELKHALFSMLQNKELRDKMVENAKIRLQDFSKEKMIKATLNVFASNSMKILMLSSDPHILEETSEVKRRMREYASIFTELHIVVVGGKKGVEELRGNLFIYPATGNLALRLLRLFMRARKVCLTHDIDVISVQAPDEYGLIGYWLSRKFVIPLQIQVHTDIMSPWYRKASWKELTRYWLALFLIPRAYSVRVVSDRIKRSLIQNTKFKIQDTKITVLPIFINIPKFISVSRDQRVAEQFRNYSFKMVAAGRFVDKEKNFGMLIGLMRDFVKICPRALLVVVGDGHDKENYKLQIINYKLENNVILEPWRDDLPSFYKLFDLYLSSSNYEGWGRTVIEAMASELPVVMTDTGLAGEVVKNRENGVIIPVADKTKFLEAIIGLYRDPAERKRLAAKAVQTVSSFGGKEEYLKLYRNVFYEITSCYPKNR